MSDSSKCSDIDRTSITQANRLILHRRPFSVRYTLCGELLVRIGDTLAKVAVNVNYDTLGLGYCRRSSVHTVVRTAYVCEQYLFS